MRDVCVGVLAMCLTASSITAGQDDSARKVLADARRALGGEAALDGIQTLSAFGRGSRALGPLQVSGAVELRIAFPNRYVRIDRLSLGGLMAEIAAGFRDDALIQRAVGPNGTAIDPSAFLPAESRAVAAQAAVAGAKQELALLLLGLFAASFDAYPLQFAYAGIAESPDGTAEVLDVLGPNGFAGRFFVDSRTRLPLMASWMAPDVLAAARTLTRTQGGDAPVIPSDAAALKLQTLPSVEHRVYFAEYRKVGPLTWPFRIRRSVGGNTSEEVLFERFTPNAAIEARVFDPTR